MTTEPTPGIHDLDSKALSRFIALPALVTVTFASLLLVRGIPLLGAFLALALPLGALGLIFVFLRDGSFRSSAGVVSPQRNARRYWLTIGMLGFVYLVGTVALGALLLRSA
jgi:hypothetical protein